MGRGGREDWDDDDDDGRGAAAKPEYVDTEAMTEEDIEAEEDEARRSIRMFNICALIPALGLSASAFYFNQFAFGTTATFLVWALAIIGILLVFTTLVGCFGAVRNSVEVLLLVRGGRGVRVARAPTHTHGARAPRPPRGNHRRRSLARRPSSSTPR
jgi:hypothetical protein